MFSGVQAEGSLVQRLELRPGSSLDPQPQCRGFDENRDHRVNVAFHAFYALRPDRCPKGEMVSGSLVHRLGQTDLLARGYASCARSLRVAAQMRLFAVDAGFLDMCFASP